MRILFFCFLWLWNISEKVILAQIPVSVDEQMRINELLIGKRVVMIKHLLLEKNQPILWDDTCLKVQNFVLKNTILKQKNKSIKTFFSSDWQSILHNIGTTKSKKNVPIPHQRLVISYAGNTMQIDFLNLPVSEISKDFKKCLFISQLFFQAGKFEIDCSLKPKSTSLNAATILDKILDGYLDANGWDTLQKYGLAKYTPKTNKYPPTIASNCKFDLFDILSLPFDILPLCPNMLDTSNLNIINLSIKLPNSSVYLRDTSKIELYWEGWYKTNFKNAGGIGEASKQFLLFDTTTLSQKVFQVNQQPFTGTLHIFSQIFGNWRFNEERYEGQIYMFEKGKFLKKTYHDNIDIVTKKPKEFEVYKPVLYLYPIQTTDISVKIKLTGHEFTHTYPQYPKETGWSVLAQPNGDLKDPKTGRNYYCLFWETKGSPLLQSWTQGSVVKGSETADFLEKTLAELGLNEREANEFIIYWLPQMENNPFNAIYFATHEYEKTSQLEIQPQPDQTIRVMMVWKPLRAPIQLQPQILPKMPTRKGFIAVEWGGVKEE